jgi:hypothetical protein
LGEGNKNGVLGQYLISNFMYKNLNFLKKTQYLVSDFYHATSQCGKKGG